jgi:hypothetical protein
MTTKKEVHITHTYEWAKIVRWIVFGSVILVIIIGYGPAHLRDLMPLP